MAIRLSDAYLYLGGYFSYKENYESVLIAYFLSVPWISFILHKNDKNLFCMLLSYLLILGVLPGVIAYAFSDNSSIWYFLLLYVFVPLLFSLIERPTFSLARARARESEGNLNSKVLLLFGFFGFIFYCYLFVKYFYLLDFRSFSNVYQQRAIFLDVVTPLESYLIPFSKYVCTASLLILAVYRRRFLYLVFLSFIFLTDYGLAAHKASIFLWLFSVGYYFYGSKVDMKKYTMPLILFLVMVFSFLMQLSLIFPDSEARAILVSIYDRIFDVTSGLFARNYYFANHEYFFRGGVGLLGKIFSGVDRNSYDVIGDYFFSKGVAANSDLVADGYINFGVAGSILQIFFLWLFVSKRDNKVFSSHYNVILPLTVVYGMVIFSAGLQTALLTGGMIFFFLFIKSGFTAS